MCTQKKVAKTGVSRNGCVQSARQSSTIYEQVFQDPGIALKEMLAANIKDIPGVLDVLSTASPRVGSPPQCTLKYTSGVCNVELLRFLM